MLTCLIHWQVYNYALRKKRCIGATVFPHNSSARCSDLKAADTPNVPE